MYLIYEMDEKLFQKLSLLPEEIENEIKNMFYLMMISTNPLKFKDELILFKSSYNYRQFLKKNNTKINRAITKSKLDVILSIMNHRSCKKDNFDDIFMLYFGFRPFNGIINSLNHITIH